MNESMFDGEEEFSEALERLNALNQESLQWKERTSQKMHEDVWGQVIEPKELYFAFDMGPTTTLRMSKASMKRFLFLALGLNAQLDKQGKKIQLERLNRIVDVMKVG
jgi:hypothetical protein